MENTGIGMGELFIMMVILVFNVLMVAALWKVFDKAGEPGWASLVPIWACTPLCAPQI
jgi:hypothetical protein